ncbi:bZIP transcription factor [Aspergillus clavatus NRRL 1]|uniref:BZIP domain-containing protein n=1 Tax=Aspergillus clavatus (strain ATCC 1007 / CBS 513.65 / DSM 816 / NCTC 3887 / NRRL 1 / QM 1276 / 107) TaxID=344612 RepID=A1CSA2_ASPCL|nr:uncharacterized protein ACLA_032590 [Aspergillus clavatus NRRL 1]EAW08523.1 conserved hypothetical protein [Aspergillus clavatus NRRL 1]
MVSNRHNASLTSSEKKRLRDRRAQKNLRDKRESRIKALEERVEYCEKHHAGVWMQKLLTTVESLHRENELLRARQERLRKMVMLWETDEVEPASTSLAVQQLRRSIDGGRGLLAADYFEPEKGLSFTPDVVLNNTPAGNPDQITGLTLKYAADRTSVIIPVNPLEDIRATVPNISSAIRLPGLPACSPVQALPSAVPARCLIPMNEYGNDPALMPASAPWLGRSDLIATCPPEPCPLDLLHGTRRNWLANEIHRAIRRRAIRDAECLAFGWLAYVYSKWRVSPNSTTFARLAPFQQPVMTQIQQSHPTALDIIIWPQLRANIIRNWTNYDFVELTGYLGACTKVRWPWGKDMLERDANDNLQMRREFFDVFTCESGWGLTSEFIDRYPELMEGIDIEALRFRMILPNEPE